MTSPVVVPSKMKAVVALVGALLSALIPLLLTISTSLPDPWPALIGGVVALLTMLGVYKAPYKPPNTVLVPDNTTPIAHPPVDPPSGGWTNPWR